jgi:hypothetical protein
MLGKMKRSDFYFGCLVGSLLAVVFLNNLSDFLSLSGWLRILLRAICCAVVLSTIRFNAREMPDYDDSMRSLWDEQEENRLKKDEARYIRIWGYVIGWW